MATLFATIKYVIQALAFLPNSTIVVAVELHSDTEKINRNTRCWCTNLESNERYLLSGQDLFYEVKVATFLLERIEQDIDNR